MTPAGRTSYIGKTIALHLHDYRATIQIGRDRFGIEPGDITLSPAGISSHYEMKESGTHLCIHFAPAGRGCSRPVRLPLHVRLGPQTSAARDRIWRVIDYTRQAGATGASLAGHAASAALQELLLWLALRQGKGATPRRHSRLEQALKTLGETIDASVARPVSMADLAAGTGLTPAYLARAFAQRYGMTVQHYLLQRRIELARHLLGTSGLLVFEIGAAVGLPMLNTSTSSSGASPG